MTSIPFKTSTTSYISKNRDKIFCMRDKKHEKRDNLPQPINAVYIVDEVTPAIRSYVVKVLKNMLYAKPAVYTGSRGYDKTIEGDMKRPINGRVKMVYDKHEDEVRVYDLMSWTKVGKVTEETDTEFKYLVFRSSEPEYNLFTLIENNWKEIEDKKKQEKAEAKKNRKLEKLASLLNNG